MAIIALIERAGEAQGQRQRRLGLDRQIGQHGLHQRLVGQEPPKTLRWPQWKRACETAIRMPADEPIMQSNRVMATIR